MNIYIGPKDQEIVRRVKEEAKKQKRSVCYIVKEALRKAFGIANGNGGK